MTTAVRSGTVVREPLDLPQGRRGRAEFPAPPEPARLFAQARGTFEPALRSPGKTSQQMRGRQQQISGVTIRLAAHAVRATPQRRIEEPAVRPLTLTSDGQFWKFAKADDAGACITST
ncbi:hypothetical protein MTO96_013191 [Rhipicephalus appendiculatus]